MLKEFKYFVDKKYKKIKYSTLLRYLRAFLRKNDIDFDKFMYFVGIKKIEHSPLTKYVRKHGGDGVQEIITKSDVDLHLGALPSELLKLIKKDDVAKKQKNFTMH